jgi:hypothetical protein
MGYTNYWHQHNDFTDTEWSQIKDEYNYIQEVCEGVIVDQSENKDEIIFNGMAIKGLDHETFILNKNTKIKTDNRDDTSQKEWIKEYNVISSFNFCKTAMKPYDLAVWHMLCFIHRICPEFAISRDR